MVEVAVGIILKNHAVFLAKRSVEKHQGGLWEFPGGKCEQTERPEAALARELREEVGIVVDHSYHLETLNYDYGDKVVQLHFFVVDAFSGEATGVEGQLTQWVSLEELNEYDFPAANQPIVKKLAALNSK
ncbi:8-oxo-dGTP diphosphatase MutT [Marinomonas agarivorans]|nr:8-oxo-dGTP diphosphatase MutT [Marinomonas agarivorans]